MSRDDRPRNDPIPEFATREGEAEFWDTHDFTDYWDDLEPANAVVSSNLTSSILLSLDLDGESLTRLCEKADSLGGNIETLARTWILSGCKPTGPFLCQDKIISPATSQMTRCCTGRSCSG